MNALLRTRPLRRTLGVQTPRWSCKRSYLEVTHG